MTTELPRIEIPSAYWDGMDEDLANQKPESIEDDPSARRLAGETISFINETREQIEAVNDVAEKNFANPMNTPAMASVKTRDYGKESLQQIEKRSNKLQSAILQRIGKIDRLINQPIKDEANARSSDEIRRYVKELPSEADRISFIMERIKSEDWETVSASIGKKSFLAGLSSDSKAELMKEYKEQRFTGQMQIRDYLSDIHSKLHAGHRTLLSKFEVLDSPALQRAEELNKVAEQAMTKNGF